jgi:prepilin peptidase CpaA
VTELEVARYTISVALTGALLWAAVSDALTRKIPNRSVIAVLALFIVWSFVDPLSNLTGALLAGAIAFVVFYALYAFRILGAGDAKLFSAVALFAGLAYLGSFSMATVLAGGAMAVVTLASRPRRALVIFNLRGRGDFGRGIPYGCAIAFGGILMHWGRLLGFLTPYTMFGVATG